MKSEKQLIEEIEQITSQDDVIKMGEWLFANREDLIDALHDLEISH